MPDTNPALDDWLRRYITAWGSNDPKEIRDLFTANAKYRTRAYLPPWEGRDTIVKNWLERKDTVGNWEFRYEILGFIGKVGYVRGWTRYKEPPSIYHNLWQVQLETDGACSDFTEWWMLEEPPKQTG